MHSRWNLHICQLEISTNVKNINLTKFEEPMYVTVYLFTIHINNVAMASTMNLNLQQRHGIIYFHISIKQNSTNTLFIKHYAIQFCD